MSHRLDLRAFQQHLSERLLAARQSEAGQSLLDIESGTDDLPGGRRWLVNLAESGEVVPLPPLTSVPLTQPWFAGIANIRGTLFSVVDFSAWRGGQPTPRTAQARLLLVGVREGINSALLVQRAWGLRALSSLHATEKVLSGDGFKNPSPDGAGEATALQGGRTKNTLLAVADGETAGWQGARFIDAQGGTSWTCLDIPALLAAPAYLDTTL